MADSRHLVAAGQIICCPKHPEAMLVEDYTAGDLICPECGMVVGDRVIDVWSEWRSFTNDITSADPSRVRGPGNFPSDGCELGTLVGPSTSSASFATAEPGIAADGATTGAGVAADGATTGAGMAADGATTEAGMAADGVTLLNVVDKIANMGLEDQPSSQFAEQSQYALQTGTRDQDAPLPQ